ncbi:MAG: hypothetical protein R2939_22205 [Kofleriaceae bacterium]
MRTAAVLLALAGCASSAAPRTRTPVVDDHAAVAPELPAELGYRRPQLAAALAAAELAAQAATQRWQAALVAGEREPWRLAADAGVARGRVTLLSTCADTGQACPPALAAGEPVPEVEASAPREPADALAVEAWRERAGRARAEACACTTVACVDGWTEELRRLERVVPSASQADAEAATHVTAARACLGTLRAGAPGPIDPDA